MFRSRQEELTGLGLLGLIPFFVAFIGVWLSPWIVPSRIAYDLREMALIYGAIIVSYLAGFAGGGILAKSPATREPLLPGMIAALVAWIAAWPVGLFGLSLPDIGRILLLIIALGYLLFRDLRAVADGLLPDWFAALRIRLSFWASISLAMIIARLLV